MIETPKQTGGIVLRADFKTKKRLPNIESEATQASAGPKPQMVATPSVPINRQKFDCFEKMINTGKTRVLVNPRYEGVALPEFLLTEIEVPIDWSWGFRIIDFAYDQTGVRGSLTFAGDPFFVDLPWGSIRAIVDPNTNLGTEWKLGAPQLEMPNGYINPAVLAALLNNLVPDAQFSPPFLVSQTPKGAPNEHPLTSSSRLEATPFARFTAAIRKWIGRVLGFPV